MHKSSYKFNSGEIRFECSLTTKSPLAILLFKFETKQENLLRLLLEKYNSEKTLPVGFNGSLGIAKCFVGYNSVMIACPEPKIAQNIILLYRYLQKMQISANQAKFCYGGGDYSKLSKDITHFTVYVGGRCKNFIAALDNKHPKISRMIQYLKETPIKDRSNVAEPKIEMDEKLTITIPALSDLSRLYLSIILNDISCEINETSIMFYNHSDHCAAMELWRDKELFKRKITGFMRQFGSFGTPSASPEGAKKHKAKVELIMYNLEMMSKMVTLLHGFEYKIKKDEVTTISTEDLTKVKSIKMI